MESMQWGMSLALNIILTHVGKFILLSLFTLLLLWIVHTHIYILYFSPLQILPAPPRWPIFHHLPYFFMSKNHVERFDSWMTKYGKNGRYRTYTLTTIGSERLVTCNPDDIKTVLISQSHKFKREEALGKLIPLLGTGLFTSEGKFHSWQRKLLNPAFSLSSIQGLTPTFTKHAERLTKCWLEKVQRKGEDCNGVLVEENLIKFAFDVTCETVFGLEANTLSEGNNQLTDAYREIIEGRLTVAGSLIQIFAPFLWNLPVGYFRAIKMAEDTVKEGVDKMIQEKKSRRERDLTAHAHAKPDLLELMMKVKDDESNEGLSDDLLRHNVFTFLLAGFDTTSTSLTWILYLLANHPDKQQLARDEAIAVLSSKPSVSWDEVQKLNYITAVIKESLRLCSPAPIIRKIATEDVSLGDIVLPKGYKVILLNFRSQKSEAYWKKPLEFLPERHFNEDGENKSMAFLPFSAGPTGCIGRRLAMVEMKIVLAFLLRTFSFSISESHPKVDQRTSLTTRPFPSPRLELTPL